jgi:DNA-binding NtrC family response regulator
VNILLIDDDASCLKTLAYVLKANKQTCRSFALPELAMEICAREDCDVVITDLEMPGLNGMQVLRRIHSLNPEIEVIIVTAKWDAESVCAAYDCGARAFMAKPLQLDSLITLLKQIEQEKMAKRSLKINTRGWCGIAGYR